MSLLSGATSRQKRGQKHRRGLTVTIGTEAAAQPILNGGTPLDGTTGVDTAMDLTIVPDGSPSRVDWLIGGVLFRDDDLGAPYTLRYNSTPLLLDTPVTAPSGATIEVATTGTSYTVTAVAVYADSQVTSTATFTTLDTAGTTGPGGGGTPGGSVGSYTQDPFVMQLVTGGTLAVDPALLPFDALWPRQPGDVGLAGAGVSRASLTTYPDGAINISAAAQPGSPTGSGTEADPYVYSLRHFTGRVTLDGDAGPFWVEFDRCWIEGDSFFGVYQPSAGRTDVHAHVYDCDFERGTTSVCDTMVAFCSNILVERCLFLRAGDVVKFSQDQTIRDCYSTSQIVGGKHVDFCQWNDNQVGKAVVTRCFHQGQSIREIDGTTHYANAGLQSKPNDSGPIQYIVEDSFIQTGGYGINRNGNNNVDSYYISRRNVFEPSIDGSRTDWIASALRGGLSKNSVGPDRTTRSSTNDVRLDGTAV